jgi:ribosomal protein S18 acetylase RimI-like enzyme
MIKETIRRARTADAETLVQLSRETFCAAFADLYWPEDLAAFLATAYGLEKTRRELADPNIGVWLALRDGAAIGFAQAGARRPAPHLDRGLVGQPRRPPAL